MVRCNLTRFSYKLFANVCGKFEPKFPSTYSNLKLNVFRSSCNLSGIFPPITTPFTHGEEISLDYLKENLNKMEKIPFKGYVVFGSSGEGALISLREKIDTVKFVKQSVSSEKLLIIGTGMESTKATIELTKEMTHVGADAALVVSPSFYKASMTEEALYTHYMTVADYSPIPVILYNVPANTAIDLTPFLIARLSNHPNIIGLKDSGGDITKIALLVHMTREKKFQIVAGSAGFLYPSLCIGCVGGIVALANSLGEEVCKLYQLFVDNKHDEAQILQQRLVGPNLAVTKRFGVAGIKKSMDLCGFYGGLPLLPLLPLTTSQEEQLEREFRANGFI